MLVRVEGRVRVGCISSLCALVALACSAEPTPSSGTGGSAPVTGGALATGGTSTGGVGTGGTSTGGVSTGGTNTGGTSTGGTSTGGALATGGTSTGGAAGAQTGGASSMGGSAAGAAGKGTSAGSSSGGAGGTTAGSGGATAGGGGAAGAATGGSGGASGFALTSPAWTSQAGCAPDNKAPCGIFPRDTTNLNGGKNQSPQLDWKGAPSGTQSYAMVMHDLSNLMGGNPFVHWVMWNISGSLSQLPANLEKTAMPSVPAGSSQRSYSGNGYMGSGKCGNVYEFVLYALPTATVAPTGTTQTQMANALKATGAPTATLRARSGAPECTE